MPSSTELSTSESLEKVIQQLAEYLCAAGTQTDILRRFRWRLSVDCYDLEQNKVIAEIDQAIRTLAYRVQQQQRRLTLVAQEYQYVRTTGVSTPTRDINETAGETGTKSILGIAGGSGEYWNRNVENCYDFTNTSVKTIIQGKEELKEGSTGASVSMLQKVLASLGYDIAVDGDFGPQTKSAVTAVQKVANVKVDGIVGPITRGILNVVDEWWPAAGAGRSSKGWLSVFG